jgi:DNA-binding MarR family transcriptional regulator
MRDSEWRGVILEALYNQRRKDLINLDDDLGGLPVPQSATESILRQLVKKGLVERPIHTERASRKLIIVQRTAETTGQVRRPLPP